MIAKNEIMKNSKQKRTELKYVSFEILVATEVGQGNSL
jgi:hypothetical protein